MRNRKKQRREKDLSQKLLMAYPDVFADIVNVLLFDGKEVVKPEDLEDADTASMYKAEGTIRPLERDVSKRWKNQEIKICEIGIENQMEIDRAMVLRSLSYDGFSYRAQIGRGEKPYPVITIVLYFGKTPWNQPKSLYEMLDIPEELKPYVNDYRLNLFELMSMDEETVKKFKSDFAIVANYLRQYSTGKYNPDEKELKHIEEAAEIMTVFGDLDLRSAVQSSVEKGKMNTMRGILSEAEKKQLLEKNTAEVSARVSEEVSAEVTEKMTAKHVSELIKNLNITEKEAMDFLKVPEELRPKVKKRIRRKAS